MLVAQILSSNISLVKFRVDGNAIEVLEGEEDAIANYVAIDEEFSRDRSTKEEHLRHYARTLENTTALQEGRGLQILSDEFFEPKL